MWLLGIQIQDRDTNAIQYIINGELETKINKNKCEIKQ